MKRYLLCGLVCGLVFVSSTPAQEIRTGTPRQFSTSNEITGALKQDTWDSDRYNVINPRTGRRTGGFVERDTWEPETRWNIYDEGGQNTGRIEKDDFDDTRWNVTEDQ